MRTLALVAGLPGLVVATITLFLMLKAPPTLTMPFIAGSIAAALGALIHFRAKNWFMYVLTTAATGCLVKGGLGITLQMTSQVEDQGQEHSRGGLIDLFVNTSSDIVSVAYIISGLILFCLAVFLHLKTRPVEITPAAELPVAEPSDSTTGTIATGVTAVAGVALAVTAAPVLGAVIAVGGIITLMWPSVFPSNDR